MIKKKIYTLFFRMGIFFFVLLWKDKSQELKKQLKSKVSTLKAKINLMMSLWCHMSFFSPKTTDVKPTTFHKQQYQLTVAIISPQDSNKNF